MGPRTVAAKKSVSADLKHLQKLAAEPKKNVAKIKPLIAKLKKVDLSAAQARSFAAIQRKMAKYIKPIKVARKQRKMSLAMRPEKVEKAKYDAVEYRRAGYDAVEFDALETEHDIVPEEARIASAGWKPIKLPINDQIKATMGSDRAKIMAESASKMVDGQLRRELDTTAGGNYHGAIMDFLKQATGVSGDFDVKNPNDPRYRAAMTTIYGFFNSADQKERQKFIDTMNMLKRGDFLKALKTLPKSSPLRGFIINDLNTIKMRTNVPTFFFGIGGDFELRKWKNGTWTLGPNLFYEHVVSQQYEARFNDQNLSWDIVRAGTTARQGVFRAGGTAKWKPYEGATMKLDISGEFPYYKVEDQESYFSKDKIQAVFSASWQDKSGKYTRIKNIPIYYGLTFTARVPSGSISLRTGAGVGFAETKTLGPLLVIGDFGAELNPGSEEFPRSMASFVGRVGLAATPHIKWLGGEVPTKLYYVQTAAGEPTQAGIQTTTQGVGAEGKLWDIKVRFEGRVNKASAIQLPLAEKDNVLFMLNFDLSEAMHKWIYKEKRK
jgi:hypothetical protein